MIKIIKQEIEIEKSLKHRVMKTCNFCNTTPTIINISKKTRISKIENYIREN